MLQNINSPKTMKDLLKTVERIADTDDFLKFLGSFQNNLKNQLSDEFNLAINTNEAVDEFILKHQHLAFEILLEVMNGTSAKSGKTRLEKLRLGWQMIASHKDLKSFNQYKNTFNALFSVMHGMFAEKSPEPRVYALDESLFEIFFAEVEISHEEKSYDYDFFRTKNEVPVITVSNEGKVVFSSILKKNNEQFDNSFKENIPEGFHKVIAKLNQALILDPLLEFGSNQATTNTISAVSLQGRTSNYLDVTKRADWQESFIFTGRKGDERCFIPLTLDIKNIKLLSDDFYYAAVNTPLGSVMLPMPMETKISQDTALTLEFLLEIEPNNPKVIVHKAHCIIYSDDLSVQETHKDEFIPCEQNTFLIALKQKIALLKQYRCALLPELLPELQKKVDTVIDNLIKLTPKATLLDLPEEAVELKNRILLQDELWHGIKTGLKSLRDDLAGTQEQTRFVEELAKKLGSLLLEFQIDVNTNSLEFIETQTSVLKNLDALQLGNEPGLKNDLLAALERTTAYLRANIDYYGDKRYEAVRGYRRACANALSQLIETDYSSLLNADLIYHENHSHVTGLKEFKKRYNGESKDSDLAKVLDLQDIAFWRTNKKYVNQIVNKASLSLFSLKIKKGRPEAVEKLYRDLTDQPVLANLKTAVSNPNINKITALLRSILDNKLTYVPETLMQLDSLLNESEKERVFATLRNGDYSCVQLYKLYTQIGKPKGSVNFFQALRSKQKFSFTELLALQLDEVKSAQKTLKVWLARELSDQEIRIYELPLAGIDIQKLIGTIFNEAENYREACDKDEEGAFSKLRGVCTVYDNLIDSLSDKYLDEINKNLTKFKDYSEEKLQHIARVCARGLFLQHVPEYQLNNRERYTNTKMQQLAHIVNAVSGDKDLPFVHIETRTKFFRENVKACGQAAIDKALTSKEEAAMTAAALEEYICRVGIDAPFIYLFINARNHNTPHRTVLEDFPHTALQFNSHCMW